MPGAQSIRILHGDGDADFADLVATILQREDNRFEIETRVHRALETGETQFDPHVEIPGPDGETRVYESRLVPIETIESERAVLGIAIDITDHETV